MKETKELPRKVMGNIRDYIEILFNGEEFTVDDVCEVTDYFNKNHFLARSGGGEIWSKLSLF